MILRDQGGGGWGYQVVNIGEAEPLAARGIPLLRRERTKMGTRLSRRNLNPALKLVPTVVVVELVQGPDEETEQEEWSRCIVSR